MVKTILDKIRNGKIKDFDSDFHYDEDYTFKFEDGSAITVKFGSMPTILFNWYFEFRHKTSCRFERPIYLSHNPFVKIYVMHVVRKRYYELIKEYLNE